MDCRRFSSVAWSIYFEKHDRTLRTKGQAKDRAKNAPFGGTPLFLVNTAWQDRLVFDPGFRTFSVSSFFSASPGLAGD
jgi:hypothetical protein